MTIYHKVQAVRKVFRQLDKDIAAFKSKSGLECFFGCGLCCQKPDIEATVLEFLPLAYDLYKEGKAEDTYHFLRELKDDKICMVYKKSPSAADRGLCTNYKNRGLICRLFGYSAMLNKYGQQELVTCRRIKEESSELYDKAAADVKAGGAIPVMSNFSRQLQAIDFDMANRRMPINKAIKEALSIVLNYYAYR